MFLYSIVYFSRLESNMFVTYLLYFGYMAVISMGVFLVTGKCCSVYIDCRPNLFYFLIEVVNLLTLSSFPAFSRYCWLLLLPVLQLPDLRLHQGGLNDQRLMIFELSCDDFVIVN